MNRWYRSAPCKGILVVLAHIAVMIVVTCLIWGVGYPGKEYGKALTDVSKDEYSATKGFCENVKSAGRDILRNIQLGEIVGTNGVYDPNKTVDINEYIDKGTVSGNSKGNFAYKLGDLVDAGTTASTQEIVVCQKEDGTYFYYDLAKFKEAIQNKRLKFVPKNEGVQFSDEEILYMLKGTDSEEEVETVSVPGSEVSIQDEKGKVTYIDFWMLNTIALDMAPTLDGKTLMEMANEDSKWNGHLEKAYDMRDQAARNLFESVNTYREGSDTWTEGNTNLEYIFADLEKKTIFTNRKEYESYEDVHKKIETMVEKGATKEGAYLIVAPKLSEFESNMVINAADARNMVEEHMTTSKNYVFAICVDTNYPIQDIFYSQNQVYVQYMPWMRVILIGGVSAAVALLIMMIWLTIIAGHTRVTGELKLTLLDKLKTEIWIICILSLCAVLPTMIATGGTFMMTSATIINQTVVMVGTATVAFALFLIGYLSFVRGLKAKSLWSNSLMRSIIKFMSEMFDHRGCTTKVILCYGGFIFLHWLTVGGGFITGFALIMDAVVFAFLVKTAIAKQRIKQGMAKIAGGEVGYKISLKGLKGDNLDIAARVNNIGEGLNVAVEENMKNERLKTDLITNVSHDIKTPLTSIINYVDLLKRENFTDPKVGGYLDVLEDKAQRLKTLTEDVVEASKISSGNIKLEYMNLNLVEMINQTNGEFTEKFEQRNLKVVLNLPMEPAVICADGHRMWRILENIYNNATKYAMEGTRIYADMTVKPRSVEFSLKNISEQPLNITADELTERFIRGDASRGTEGSGLGLSIAKSLTELQGGQFQLYLDGDLFKVTIIFPRVYRKQEQPHGPMEVEPGDKKI